MKIFLFLIPAVFLTANCSDAHAELTVAHDEKQYTVLEDEKAVLVFNHGVVEPPEGVEAHYARSCYVHPLYGLDGEVLTQDFPGDHYHHRGVFWAWPEVFVGERKIDIWACSGAKQKNREVAVRTLDSNLELTAHNFWHFDEDETPIVEETVVILVHPEIEDARAVDFDITLKNVTAGNIDIRGQDDKNKGYGGFNIRPDAKRLPFKYTSAVGRLRKDALELESPWVDCSFATVKGEEEKSGFAIFQHPGNPGYPHPGWIIRHFGLLGQSYPHRGEHKLAPGDNLRLRYRVLIHRGDANKAAVGRQFDAYTNSIESQ